MYVKVTDLLVVLEILPEEIVRFDWHYSANDFDVDL
jgi:hypothetical protein